MNTRSTFKHYETNNGQKKCVPIPLGIYINSTFSLWNGHTLLALLACFNIQLAFIWMLRHRNSTMEYCIGTRAISVKQNLKKSLCSALINFFDTEFLVSLPHQHSIKFLLESKPFINFFTL